jgi:hypothetical protein
MTAIAPHRRRGCGVVGRLSRADPDPNDRRPILRIAFDGPAGKPQLLCALCRPAEISLNLRRMASEPDGGE